MASTDTVYVELQKHLDKQAVGFPATESGVEIRILKELFTPQQASLALSLSFEPQTVTDIHKNAWSGDMSVEKVKSLLEGMVDNGSIGIVEKNVSSKCNDDSPEDTPVFSGYVCKEAQSIVPPAQRLDLG